jgi:pyrrolysine biosynthesis protein PylC
MVVAIAGGALQGLELTYLANKAGFETLLLDRRRDAPATGICDRFAAIDLTDRVALRGALRSVDLVFPATEDAQALQTLHDWCSENRTPLAFDADTYAISSSKSASDALFRKLDIPAPAPWPDCPFPVLAKPDGKSGGKGVEVFQDLQTLEARYGTLPPSGCVLQEYLHGPSYSIEVIGRPGNYNPLQITTLEMDQAYDCKRVVAPSSLPSDLTSLFEEIATTLAEAVGLKGIMDVEAILHGGQLKVLEIDARFPSQTPTAVYHSTGTNMVERLASVVFTEHESEPDPIPVELMRGSVVEHIEFRGGHLSVCGEQIMAEAGPLHIESDFFGAEEALTSHTPGIDDWVATLLIRGSDVEDAERRRDRVIREIRNRCGAKSYSDEYPRARSRQGG